MDMSRRDHFLWTVGISVSLGLGTGCDLLQGLKPATLVETGGGGQGGTGDTGGATTAGTGGTSTCEPGTSIACYTGPDGTEEVAMCKGGMRACKADGSGYDDACQGEVLPAPETCASTGDEDCDKLDCVRWAAVFGDGSEQVPLDIGVDVLGNVYVLGKFKGAIPFGNPAIVSAGGWDFFLVKLDPAGKVLWNKQFGDAAEQEDANLAVDPAGSAIVAGKLVGMLDFGGGNLPPADIFVAKLDAAGEHVWSKSFVANATFKPSVASAPDGSAILWADFLGSANFGTGPLVADPDRESVLTSLAADDGAPVWLRTFVSTGAQSIPGTSYNHTSARSIATDASGNITIAGTFGGKKINLGGDDIPEVGSGFGGGFLARFDKLGNHAWSVSELLLVQMSVDPLGGVALSGLDNSDGFAPCTSANALTYSNVGMKQWSAGFICPDQGKDVTAITTASDLQGDVVVAMVSWDGPLDFAGNVLPGIGPADLILGKLASVDGTHLWSRRFGAVGAAQAAPVVATAPNGDILLAASVSGPIDVGTGPLPNQGQDLLIARFAP